VLIAGGVFTALIGLLFAWVAWGSAWSLLAALHGTDARGTVIKVKTVDANRRHPLPHAAVEFTTAAGQTIRFVETRPSYGEPGNAVAVRYLPSRPKRATLARPRDLWQPAATFTILSAAFLTAGIWAILDA
jgi:hypothetical protein